MDIQNFNILLNEISEKAKKEKDNETFKIESYNDWAFIEGDYTTMLSRYFNLFYDNIDRIFLCRKTIIDYSLDLNRDTLYLFSKSNWFSQYTDETFKFTRDNILSFKNEYNQLTIFFLDMNKENINRLNLELII